MKYIEVKELDYQMDRLFVDSPKLNEALPIQPTQTTLTIPEILSLIEAIKK